MVWFDMMYFVFGMLNFVFVNKVPTVYICGGSPLKATILRDNNEHNIKLDGA